LLSAHWILVTAYCYCLSAVCTPIPRMREKRIRAVNVSV
jgi:hypothetical protein